MAWFEFRKEEGSWVLYRSFQRFEGSISSILEHLDTINVNSGGTDEICIRIYITTRRMWWGKVRTKISFVTIGGKHFKQAEIDDRRVHTEFRRVKDFCKELC